MSYEYLINCVSARGNDIAEMVEKAREITAKTFKKHCNYKEASRMLGYTDENDRPFCPELTLESDYSTAFFKSKYKGTPCYFIEWSGIEHVYTERK